MKTQEKKTIEFVCLGNNGRSPILETVCRDEAKKMNVEDKVEITSSGLYVKRRHPFDMLVDTIKKQLDSKVMEIYGSEKEEVIAMLNNPELIRSYKKYKKSSEEYESFGEMFLNLLKNSRYEDNTELREKFLYYFDQVYRPLLAMDVALRDNVLARHGLKYESPRHQFPSTANLDYIITATDSLVGPTKSYLIDLAEIGYEEDLFFALVGKVKSVAEMTEIPDLKGGFGTFDINFYEQLYEQSRKATKIIIEKVLGDCS